MADAIALHEALQTIDLQPLMSLELVVDKVFKFGGEGISRQVGSVSGGRFVGEKLSGKVLSGGNDWQTVHADGRILLDARIPLETDDGAAIIMSFQGVRWASEEVQARMMAGEAVDPREYYFRITPLFYTSAPRYDWLNRVVALGTGHRLATGPVYNILAVA